MNITASDFMKLQSFSLDHRHSKQRLIAHRRERSLSLGPCMRLQFEDELTIRHQIQEVLRARRIGGTQGMQQEVHTYNLLVPDGSNWKATLMIELPDTQAHKRELPQLNEAAQRLYVDLPRQPRVYAEVHEDLLDRQLNRPSAVYLLHFPFSESWRATLLGGATAALGCAHDGYEFRRVIPPATINSLRRDLVVATHALASTGSAVEAAAS